ncbi:bifunctional acetate--CoA ligase family protein/GNAT family N-acetyltransferase [Streptosporangium sp. H16]|uniref:bifunctional acetate--CoA ligase family protein/GNAT family N-acetyltransferase n=1 Tax=Streptosporangium sp. H16 TaxID=3444184 RepID=UPI003F7AE879
MASFDECDALLRNGEIAHVRPLRGTDRAALHDLVDRTSARSAYLRFFTAGRATAHRYMDRLTGPDHRGHAQVALLADKLVAVAEYIPDEDRHSADVSVLIDDRVHGRGLGTLLLEHLALDAAARGVSELVADVLTGNGAMLKVLTDLGLAATREFAGDEVRVRIDLRPTDTLTAAIERRDHEAERASLARVLSPRSVAVVGASREPDRVGHRLLGNLLDGAFPGPVYPVNPKAAQILGVTAYPDLSSIGEPVDLVVVATPASAVLDVARECAGHGVAGLVVVSAGFAETGPRGAARQAELLRVCRSGGMRLIGPNCLGIVNTGAALNASFLPHPPPPGAMALMSQSGAVAAGLVARATELQIGISSFVSVGNKADVSGNDLLEYWEDDPRTEVIALYLESFGNPRKFGRIARRVGRHKPIVAIKSGRSTSGDRAVRSHTAAAATPDIAVETLLRAAGVIRVDGMQELLDTARLLATQPLPAGGRMAIVGNSGGPQALAADACERHGLVVPELSPATQRRMRSRLRASAAVANPVDLTADGQAEELEFAALTALEDPAVDAVLIVYTPPFGSGLQRTREAIARVAGSAGKTVVACVVGHDETIGSVPAYAFPEQAVQALSRAAGYARWRSRPAPPFVPPAGTDIRAARELVEEDLSRHPAGRWLDPVTAARLLACYGVAVAEFATADSADEAVRAAARLGFPVALKATGPVHKSDVGGVRLGLRTSKEVRGAYRAMKDMIGPEMTGATVQPMAPDGVEIIVGAVRHPSFGPLVMVGMGGVSAELLTDRAFRSPPLTGQDATEMIQELHCAPLLFGYRGRPVADTAAVKDHIVRVAKLVDDLPQIAELDLNPIIAGPGGAVAVDLRIRLAPAPPAPSPLRRQLR